MRDLPLAGQYVYWYLWSKLLQTRALNRKGTEFYKLSDATWHTMILDAEKAMKAPFSDCCIRLGGDERLRPQLGFHKADGCGIFSYFTFIHQVFCRQRRTMCTARFIAAILYGGDALVARHASHLCGNGLCLSPAHIFLELPHINFSRDECHLNGKVGDDCKHMPKYIKCENLNLLWFTFLDDRFLGFSSQIRCKQREEGGGRRRPHNVCAMLAA